MCPRLAAAESTLAAIERLAGEELTAQELLHEVGPRIDRVVPSDGYFLSAADPQTTLCMGAGVVHELPHEMCEPTWNHEFLVPDYLKFADMIRAGRAVVDIHAETGGRPERSPRWRHYRETMGFAGEVRTAFMVGESAWGVGQFNRFDDSPRYSDVEKAWLERVAPIVGEGLRRSLAYQPSPAPSGRGPGIVLLDPKGDVVSATVEAIRWFDEIEPVLRFRRDAGFSIPFEVHSYALRVRASLDDPEPSPVPRGRVRTRTGVWLILHASPLQGTDQLALTVEPAKASEVAPLIVEAYGLSQRELQVTRAIARGLGTSEIAGELFLSPHTVRDHVKAVFEKVGVSSRGELVAKMFAEHYGAPDEFVNPDVAA